MPGTLFIKPVEANLVRDTATLRKMDPYCRFSIGNQMINSEVCKTGGTHPHWKQSLDMHLNIDQSKCLVEVIDEDLPKDDQIGSCEIDLNEVRKEGQLKKWYPSQHGNKKAGEILLELSFQNEAINPADEKIEEEIEEMRMEGEGGHSPAYWENRKYEKRTLL